MQATNTVHTKGLTVLATSCGNNSVYTKGLVKGTDQLVFDWLIILFGLRD